MYVKYLVLLFWSLSVKLQITRQMSHDCITATLPKFNCNNTTIQVNTLDLKLCPECMPGNRQNNIEWIKCNLVCNNCKFVSHNSRDNSHDNSRDNSRDNNRDNNITGTM